MGVAGHFLVGGMSGTFLGDVGVCGDGSGNIFMDGGGWGEWA